METHLKVVLRKVRSLEWVNKTNSDGSYFKGEYRDDVPNGKGSYYWAHGEEYHGDWVNGKFHGYGGMLYICMK